jgi:hypothetical protein
MNINWKFKTYKVTLYNQACDSITTLDMTYEDIAKFNSLIYQIEEADKILLKYIDEVPDWLGFSVAKNSEENYNANEIDEVFKISQKHEKN